jgi:hypothetical protein
MTPSLTPGQNLIANGLVAPNSIPMVVDISGQFQQLTSVIQALNNSRPMEKTKITTSDRQRTIARMGDTTLTAQILNSTVTSSTAVINFTDPTYVYFGVSEQLLDTNTKNLGIVVNAQPGQVTLTVSTASGFNPATDFAAGVWLSSVGSKSTNRSSTSLDMPFFDPTKDYNYSSIIRRKTTLARTDLFDSRLVNFRGEWWYHAYERQMLQQLMFEIDRSMLVSQRYYNPTLKTYINGGLDWVIQNRGGQMYPLSTNYTENDYKAIIQHIIMQKATKTTDIWCFCGSVFKSTFQTNMENIQNVRYEVYSANKNPYTLNGMKLSFDVTEYIFMGTAVKLVDLRALDHKEFWGTTNVSLITGQLRESSTAYWLNLAPLPGYGGEGEIPALEMIWTAAPNAQSPFGYGYIPGTIRDFEGTQVGVLNEQAKAFGNVNFTASDLDNITAFAYADIGLDGQDGKGFVKSYLTI